MTFETWLQTRLIAHGYPPAVGGADGVWGRSSIDALKRFQTARGLPVTGVADMVTVSSLRAVPLDGSTGLPKADTAPAQPSATPPWYAEAKRLTGTREVAGSGNSPTIMGWARRLGLWYPDDATPWCGLFVAHCIGLTLPDEPLPTNPLGARNWLNFGVKLISPALGAIMVFSRPGSSWSGHVAFYEGEDATTYSIRGGNQSDSVNVIRIAKSRFLGVRWPQSYPLPARTGPLASTGGTLSRNEA